MTYLYRRTARIADMFISKTQRVKINVRDGATQGGIYTLVIGTQSFQVSDPDPLTVSSDALVTQFETLINASATVEAVAVAQGSVLVLTHKKAGKIFAVKTHTSDPEGSIYLQDAPHQEYKAFNLPNWDEGPALVETLPMQGKASETAGAEALSFKQDAHVRWRFVPSDYALDDDDVLFFTFVPVADGVDGLTSPIYILMTSEQMLESHTPLILQGAAPLAADSDSALELRFPVQPSSIKVTNKDGAVDLYLSFGTGNAELKISPGDSYSNNRFGTGDIRVRGDGAAVSIEITATLNFQRLL